MQSWCGVEGFTRALRPQCIAYSRWCQRLLSRPVTMGVPATSDTGQPKTRKRVALDAAAGAIAGCISRFIVGPLDVIKIRFQVQLEPLGPGAVKAASKYTGFTQALATIFKEEGVQGLWRGTVPGILLTVPYTAVQFVALHQLRETAGRMGITGQPGMGPVVSLATGALAGAAGTVASYPFDLLRTTMAAQGEPRVYGNMWQAARGITAARGLPGLYAGLGVTVVEIMPYAALQFGVYDALQAAWASSREAAERTPSGAGFLADTRLASFACGLAAGLAAKLVSHPLDVAKKRYQVAGLARSLRYGARVEQMFALKSLGAGLADIYTREGMAGLWKGSVPSIIKAAPAAAITFTAYEAILGMLLVATAEHVPSAAANSSAGGGGGTKGSVTK